MKMLHFLGKPLYSGLTNKFYRRSLRETLLYADQGKVHIVSIIPSAGNPGRDGKGARTEVRNEIGFDKCHELLDAIEEGFGAMAIEQMAARVSEHLKQEREAAEREQELLRDTTDARTGVSGCPWRAAADVEGADPGVRPPDLGLAPIQ